MRWHPVGTNLAARAGLAQARSGQETLRHEPRGLHAPHPWVNSTQQAPPSVMLVAWTAVKSTRSLPHSQPDSHLHLYLLG